MKPDIRDFLLLAGLGMLGYGLYTGLAPWIAFAACGAILMIIGLSMGGTDT